MVLLETIRYVEHDAPDRGGVFVLLDNEKAFDRVSRDFMLEAMAAMGVPEPYLAAVRTMYKGARTRVKVNGELTPAFTASSRKNQDSCFPQALQHDERLDGQRRIRHAKWPGFDGR